MNLFISGWSLEADKTRLAIAALAETSKLYPTLENGCSYSWRSECSSVFLACQFPSADYLESRQYVFESDESVVAYDGLPVDADDRFSAHQASDLASYWDTSTEDLDGFFCALRIQKRELQLELQLDGFGVYPLFYWTDGTSWLISNSVTLLDRVTGERQLDTSGVSRFLTMGWVAGDRTLRQNVRAFPAGERWTWCKDRSEPVRRSTVNPRELAHKSKRELTRSQIAKLSQDMASPLVSLGRNFEEVLCPLTGGRDSRVLASLLAANDVTAQYYTYGNQIGRDAEIAKQIADVLRVDHETLVTESLSLLSDWDDTVKGYILRGDGMCPLQLIMGAVTAGGVATAHKPVRIWGAGGEVARAMYLNPIHEIRRATVQDIQKNIALRWINDANGMIRPEACASARSFVNDTIMKYADEGFHVDDLNDVFFLYERGARRAGRNMRATMSLRDSYSPFFSRPFVEAVFSSSVRSRRTAALHYRLIEELTPAALAIPFDKGAWSRRSPTLNLYLELYAHLTGRIGSRLARLAPALKKQKGRQMIVKDTMFQRVVWLKQIQEKFREMCLDGSSSPVWDYIDRDRFEAVTSPSAAESNLAENAKILFLTATLFYYESHTGAIDVTRIGIDES